MDLVSLGAIATAVVAVVAVVAEHVKTARERENHATRLRALESRASARKDDIETIGLKIDTVRDSLTDLKGQLRGAGIINGKTE